MSPSPARLRAHRPNRPSLKSRAAVVRFCSGERTYLALEGDGLLQLRNGTGIRAGDLLQLNLDEHLIILTGSEPALRSGKSKHRNP